MALKPDRNYVNFEVGFFCNQTNEPGVVLCSATSTPGSGAAMDSFAQLAERATSVSGRYPLGILLNPVVDRDLTDTVLNGYKEEVQVGNKVALLSEGYVVTNQLVPTATASIVPGAPAYAGPSGLIDSVQSSVSFNKPQIGRFLSRVDQDGYAKVEIDIR